MTDSIEWQPIETAPKDVELVWLCVGGEIFIGYFDPPVQYVREVGGWVLKAGFRENRFGRDIYSCHHECKGDEQPTHWMPLPPPPEQKP